MRRIRPRSVYDVLALVSSSLVIAGGTARAVRRSRLLVAFAAFVAALVVVVPAASAEIYWANDVSNGSIGSANDDGTGVNQQLVPDVNHPCAVAADGQHVFWATHQGLIGRANVDGSNVQRDLIRIQFSCGQIAVDGAHIYWTDQSQGNPAIGRANLDGTNVRRSWLPLPGQFPLGLAIDGEHVYWTWQRNQSESDIGRADIDGTGVTSGFIQAASHLPWFLAVDAAHIYASPFGARAVLRANLDGTHVENDFMDIPPQDHSCGLAVDDQHLYWGAFSSRVGNAVGRASVDGTGIDPSFITGGQSTCGVAVGPAQAPVSRFSLGKVTRNERRGTAKLLASVPEPGRLLLSGAGLRTQIRAPLRPRDVKLPVRPKGHKKRVLERTGEVRVRARVIFHPHCGCREVEHRALTLKKRT